MERSEIREPRAAKTRISLRSIRATAMRRFAMLHRIPRCVSKPSIIAGPGRPHRPASKVPSIPRAWRPVRDGAEPADMPIRSGRRRGRQRSHHIRHGGPLRDGAVRACARRAGARRGQGRPRRIRDVARRQSRPRPPRAQPGVHRRTSRRTRSKPCSTRPASAASRRTSSCSSRASAACFWCAR